MIEGWLKGEECQRAMNALAVVMEKFGVPAAAAAAKEEEKPKNQQEKKETTVEPPAQGPQTLSTLAELKEAVAARFKCPVGKLDKEFAKIEAALGDFVSVEMLRESGVPAEVERGVADVIRKLISSPQ
jgi:hypothetical protein